MNTSKKGDNFPLHGNCYLGDCCLCHTNQVSFLHLCTGCQAIMHVICGEVDNHDCSWCADCINSSKYDIGELLSNNHAALDQLKEKEDQLNKLQRENEEKEMEILPMMGNLKDDKMLKKMEQMQHELMELGKEKENKETEMLQMAHGIAEDREWMKCNPNSKKKEIVKVKLENCDGATIQAEAIMDDATSLEDATVDYTLPKNYSVKCFVSHKLTMKGNKGPPIIELQATWKGYPGSAVYQLISICSIGI